MRLTVCIPWTLGMLISATVASSAIADTYTLFLGTYTREQSKGIYKCDFDTDTGALSRLEVAAEAVNPSFLAIHPTGKYLYAVGEIDNFDGKKAGAVSAFSIDPQTHKLTRLNQQHSGGAGPCHLTVNKSGKFVLVANYGGGTVSSIAINEDGSLGKLVSSHQHEGSSVNPRRQTAPHAHSVNLDAANKFAFVADLGLDKIKIYRFNATTGELTPNDPPFARVPDGGGPRHFAFHPNGKFAYCNNEMLLSVNLFTYDADAGRLEIKQTVGTVTDGLDLTGNSTAEIVVHPNGRFAYVSNRGIDTVTAFAVDVRNGFLRQIEQEPTGGKTPRNFAIDPSGTFLLAENQNSDNVVVFRINQDNGSLERTAQQLDVPSPVCARFLKQP